MNVEEYARMYEAEETQWWYAGMRAISLSLLAAEWPEGAEGRRILDAGCGTGNNLVHFRRFGRTVGVDLSDEALRLCRSRGVAAARGSLLSLPFPDGSFDAVTSFDVLYHRWVEDDRVAVRETVRVMKPGGLLLLRVPALKMLWGAHDEAVHSRHRYTRGEVRPNPAPPRLGRGFPARADGMDVPQPARSRGPAGAASLPSPRGQPLRSRAQARHGRGGGPRLESPTCGAKSDD